MVADLVDRISWNTLKQWVLNFRQKKTIWQLLVILLAVAASELSLQTLSLAASDNLHEKQQNSNKMS